MLSQIEKISYIATHAVIEGDIYFVIIVTFDNNVSNDLFGGLSVTYVN